jgi:hypothetical protein
MAITLATGTVAAIASTYGTQFTITAITNATEAVATLSASHGVIVGDYLEITSGWDRLNGRVVRAKTVATNDVTLEGINTTSTTNYPTGSGIGTGREITAWTNLSQLTADLTVGGGDLNFADVTTLTDVIQKQIPTTRSAITMGMPTFFDDSLSWVAAVKAAADAATPTALRLSFPNSNKLVANGYWSYQTVPTVTDSTLRGRVDVSFSAAPVLYAT